MSVLRLAGGDVQRRQAEPRGLINNLSDDGAAESTHRSPVVRNAALRELDCRSPFPPDAVLFVRADCP